MESYKNSLHVFVDVIHKKFVSIHLIYGNYLNNQTMLTQTKILCIDEKGVQVITETGTLSAKGSIVTDCGSLL
jgi:hypothetical protein